MATSSVPLSQAYPGATMFAYCTERLHLSEAEAYLRIAAARASREHPILLAMLADGRLHLTAIAKLAPHLTPENPETLPEAGHPPVEARGRGAGRRAGASSGCAGSDAEAARPRPGTTPVRSPDRPGPSRLTRLDSVWTELSPRAQADGDSAAGHRRSRGTAPAEPAPSGRRSIEWHGRNQSSSPRRSGAAVPGLASPQPVAPRPSVGAPRPRPLQGPVHRQRRAPRQARAARGPHALLGARRRPRRRSSNTPSPRSSRGSRPGASRRRRPRGRPSPTARRRRPRATSRPPSGGPCTSGTGAVAATWTSRADGARRATVSNSTTGARSATAVTTRPMASRSPAKPTTPTWRRSTTVGGHGPAPVRKGCGALPTSPQPRLPVSTHASIRGSRQPASRVGATCSAERRAPDSPAAGGRASLPFSTRWPTTGPGRRSNTSFAPNRGTAARASRTAARPRRESRAARGRAARPGTARAPRPRSAPPGAAPAPYGCWLRSSPRSGRAALHTRRSVDRAQTVEIAARRRQQPATRAGQAT